ncbi:unnamed protein product [Symbiodinium necroappetens]|uniref:DUF2189 domain-containing protein n=1 Tax=Symbiodinium necroappetens TaxID=1628268 RepID=A0A813AMW6_9DINO|nr:unnamed protein product [Symbiodinium necroappetens]
MTQDETQEGLGRESDEVVPVFGQPLPKIRKISVDRPWAWLAAGWQDLRSAPSVGLGYGAIFTVVGFLLLGIAYELGLFWQVLLPIAGGFLLVAPVLAVGLYETSRRLQAGEPTSMALALAGWQRNLGQIALIGVVGLVLWIAWMRLAFLIFMLFFSYEPPRPDNFLADVFLSDITIPFLLTGTAVGAVLALIAFAISAVSVPMLMDRDVNVMAAVVTSVEAVRQNFFPMLVWASLIVLFTAAGLLTFYFGLIITLPLIGHATWHAYRDLVASE